MRRVLIAFILLLALPVVGQQGMQHPYPVFETDKISPAEFKQRREKLKQAMGPGSLGVFFTSPTRNRNNDTDYEFRGDSNFLYLTGFEEPDAALLLVPDGVEMNGKKVTEVLCVNMPNPTSETWLGYRMGPENVTKLLGIEAALPNSQFEQALAKLAASAPAKKLTTGAIPEVPMGTGRRGFGGGGGLDGMVVAFENWRKDAGFTPGVNGRGFVSGQRGVKSVAEVALLRHAASASALAHAEAMRSCEPGMREYQIGTLIRYLYEREGCEFDGYPPICGSGMNGTILHYESDRGVMKSGDMIVVDAAGEFHGYSADITRSYPVNGHFTVEQRAIYDIVLKAQNAGIAQVKSGGNMGAVEGAADTELANGLMKLGIIKSRNELGRYYMHGIGHGIGLDVHDPAGSPLRPNVVVTVEPGIYIKAGSPCDPKWWNIGCRIEDDILVTETGNENLSAGCPRDPGAIEKLMLEKGIGNLSVRPVSAR